MPGIVGFVRPLSRNDSSSLMARLARGLEADPRFKAEIHAEEGFGLGRISLGILQPQPQPVWSEDGNLGLVMEGEFFGREELAKKLVERGRPPRAESDPELALELYRERGEEFVSSLNGAFLIAIWDRRSRRMVVANDRLGLVPLYYARLPQGLLFASGVRALLAEPALPRQVDRTAIAEMLTFDHILGQRTLLKSVSLLPQATIMTVEGSRMSLRQYWRPTFPETYPVFREADYVEEGGALLRQAIARQTGGQSNGALLLSGGLDSRALLGVLAEQSNGHGMQVLTWGIPGCDDVRFARAAARAAGARFEFLALRPDWLVGQAENGVRITDGMGNLVNLHALAVAPRAREHADVLYKGFLGDAMFGFGIPARYWADYDDETALDVHLQAYRDYRVLSFDFPEHPSLFTPAFRSEVGDGVREDYRAAMRVSNSRQLSDQRIAIDLTQRVPRMTLNGVEVTRDQAAVRLPFCDNDLVDFSLRIPPGLRTGRQVLVRFLVESFPKLAQVPVTPSGLPLMACAGDVAARGRQLIQWHLRKRGLARLAGPTARPSKDYAAWFRGGLRGWMQATLLSPAALDRGYFQPDYIRGVVAAHLAGENHAVRLGSLLSLELWHKMYLD